MSHTPGPWTCEYRHTTSGRYEYVIHLNLWSREFESWGWGCLHRIIAYGCGVGQNELNPSTEAAHAEAKANVHLIAAAPDLFAALNLMVKRHTALVNSGDCGFWNPETDEEVIAARTAIAKAEGK